MVLVIRDPTNLLSFDFRFLVEQETSPRPAATSKNDAVIQQAGFMAQRASPVAWPFFVIQFFISFPGCVRYERVESCELVTRFG
jgi:hypothetical protein